jgi:hypothetical protein
MHVVPIFIQIQKLWHVLGVFILFAQILNGILLPTTYSQKLDADITQSIIRYRKLHKYLQRTSQLMKKL